MGEALIVPSVEVIAAVIVVVTLRRRYSNTCSYNRNRTRYRNTCSYNGISLSSICYWHIVPMAELVVFLAVAAVNSSNECSIVAVLFAVVGLRVESEAVKVVDSTCGWHDRI